MNGRSFIAGDAAHIHTPAGGQGMNTGIQDAYNLAWKIAYSIKYIATPALLESYNTERMANAKHLLKTTDKMFDFMIGSGRLLNFIRLKIFPFLAKFISGNKTLNKKLFPLLSQIGIAYPDSILTIKSSIGKVNAGDRIPYFSFASGKSSFDLISKPAFKLLFFGNKKNAFSEEFSVLKYDVLLIEFNEIPDAVFGHASEFYVLIRPDNHISYIGYDINCCIVLLKQIVAVSR